MSNKLLIVVIGIIAFFTQLLLRGIYLGYLAPAHLWVADVGNNHIESAMLLSWVLDFLVVAVPVSLLFGVTFGLSYATRPFVYGLSIGVVYIITEWINFLFLFYPTLPMYKFNSLMVSNYIIQDLLIMVLFVLAVLCGNKLKKIIKCTSCEVIK